MSDNAVKLRLYDGSDRSWFNEIVKRASDPDPVVQAELCEFLDANPDVYRKVSDLMLPPESRWIDLIAGGNREIADTVRRETEERRTRLLGENPSEFVAMIVNSIILDSLALRFHLNRFAGMADASRARLAPLIQRIDKAQEDVWSGLSTLNSVRHWSDRGDSLGELRVSDREWLAEPEP